MVHANVIDNHMLRENRGVIRRPGPVAAYCHVENDELREVKGEIACIRSAHRIIAVIVNQPAEMIGSPYQGKYMKGIVEGSKRQVVGTRCILKPSLVPVQ